MLYATWSEGFRPGGINRRGTLPPYEADFLTNYEIGFKTTWADNRVRFNGAIFQDDWDDFQYSFLGANGLTEIRNAGQARIKGIEADITWAVTDAFTLSTCGSRYSTRSRHRITAEPLTTPAPIEGEIVTNCDDPLAPVRYIPAGARRPGAAGAARVQGECRGPLRVRHGGHGRALPGARGSTHGTAWTDLRTDERELLGKQPSYDIVDFSFGVEKESWGLEAVRQECLRRTRSALPVHGVLGVQAVQPGC